MTMGRQPCRLTVDNLRNNQSVASQATTDCPARIQRLEANAYCSIDLVGMPSVSINMAGCKDQSSDHPGERGAVNLSKSTAIPTKGGIVLLTIFNHLQMAQRMLSS